MPEIGIHALTSIRALTPTEAATFYSLIITGVIGGIGTLILAEKIKDKKEIPIGTLITWSIVFGVITIASVSAISKAARSF